MTSGQFLRALRKLATIDVIEQSGSGHRWLHNLDNDRWSVIPWHGGGKQLKKGVMLKIKKDLGLK